MSATVIMWEDEAGAPYFISVDATLGATHAYNNTVTDHPVEKGANLTDHVRPDPARLQITGQVSNTPHFLPKDHVGGAEMQPRTVEVTVAGFVKVLPVVSATAAIQAITAGSAKPLQPAVLGRVTASSAAAARVVEFNQEFDRVVEVFQELVRLRNKGTLLRVLTRYVEYENMVIEVLTFPEDPNIGESLVFDMSLKQVRTVETRTVQVAAHKGTVSKQVITPAEEKQADNTVVGVAYDKATGFLQKFFGN